MRTIWKYTIPVQDHCVVQMPRYSKFLAANCGAIIKFIDIWVQVSVESETDNPIYAYGERYFSVVGTGRPIPHFANTYLATVQAPPLVWHLFEAEGVQTMDERTVDAKVLAAEWVEAHFTTKSKQRDLYRTRAAIRKTMIEEQLVDQTDDFLTEFYSEVGRLLAEKVKKG